MNYDEALSFIYSRRKFAKSSGLERMSALLDKLGNVQRQLNFVHVVGTNGKGSVVTMVSSVLTSAGYKTGAFISPFVTQFRERIQIDSSYISESSFCQVVLEIKNACDELEKEGICPTFFEAVLAAALLYFKNENCDIVVLEAGIGGRDDSTNIIAPPLAVAITSISLDHVDVLGNSISLIAKAKSAVIKAGSEVVSFPDNNCGLDFVPQKQEAIDEIKERCVHEKCNLTVPDMSAVEIMSERIDETVFVYRNIKIKMNFAGHHQIANAATALEVIFALKRKGLAISDSSITQGFEKAFIPGRMEVLSRSPLVLADGGHNEGCMKALSKLISRHLMSKKITMLLGFMKDKDYKTAIEIIAPYCSNIVFTLADEARGEAPDTLLKCAKPLCCSVYTENNIEFALRKAESLSGEDGVLICAGSFYLVSEVRKFF